MKRKPEKHKYFQRRLIRLLGCVTISDSEAVKQKFHNAFCDRLLRVLSLAEILCHSLINRVRFLEAENRQLKSLLKAPMKDYQANIKARDMKRQKSRYSVPTIKEKVILRPLFYLLLIIIIVIVFVGPLFIKP